MKIILIYMACNSGSMQGITEGAGGGEIVSYYPHSRQSIFVFCREIKDYVVVIIN